MKHFSWWHQSWWTSLGKTAEEMAMTTFARTARWCASRYRTLYNWLCTGHDGGTLFDTWAHYNAWRHRHCRNGNKSKTLVIAWSQISGSVLHNFVRPPMAIVCTNEWPCWLLIDKNWKLQYGKNFNGRLKSDKLSRLVCRAELHKKTERRRRRCARKSDKRFSNAWKRYGYHWKPCDSGHCRLTRILMRYIRVRWKIYRGKFISTVVRAIFECQYVTKW